MTDEISPSDLQVEYTSLKKTFNALSRKYDRMEREFENLTHLYKQAVALRDFNEEEKETQMRYNQMLRDHCPDELFLLDTSMRILLCTSSVKTYFNNQLPEIVGRDVLPFLGEIFDCAFIGRMENAILHVKEVKSPTYFDVEASRHSGELLYFSVRIVPVMDDQGELTGMVILLHDTSELHMANIKAQQASLAKGEFLSRMSHEMRTPMNAIIGMTSIAKNTADPEKKDYCLEKIDGASQHLLSVINDILDMSKIEANKFELSCVEFDFEKMLIGVTNVINFRVEEKRQTLVVNVDPGVPHSIISDELRLTQVISNLLTNAVKFTPEGGTILLRAMRLPDVEGQSCLQISVSDNGIGISAEQQGRLFNSFEQAEGGTARKYGGTGLGLAISKRIVELMGGKIWIESELNQGAKFIFTILYKKGKAKKHTMLNMNNEDLRILAVDDSPEIRDYFQSIFAAFEIACDVASDGYEALSMIERCEEKPYNIFFIDWQMPGMNGVELAKKIKEGFHTNSIIIMISAADWSGIEPEATSVGINHFISKPLFPSVLINTINQCLGTGSKERKTKKMATQTIHDYTNHTILIAEDVDVNQEIMSALLEDTGLKIHYAETGEQAIARFRADPNAYSLILMDIHMPEMDGYQATRIIRSLDHEKAKTIPIIAMTANVFREDIEMCMEAGMNDHLGKPVDTHDLFEKLDQYLPKSTDKSSQKPIMSTTPSSSMQSIASYADLLPVIDVADGLSRLMNNKKLYLSLLNRFTGRKMADELIQSINEGDFTKAQQAAHALKGVSANLGLSELMRIAANIEAQAKMQVESLQLIATLDQAVDAAAASIKLLLEFEVR